MNTLLNIGQGYVADALSARLMARGWAVRGTARDLPAPRTRADGVRLYPWPMDATAALDGATHLLLSAPPEAAGDPVLAAAGAAIAARADRIAWIGYLSTTGVWGDHGGAWVDEATPPDPGTERGRRRLQAERDWAALAARSGLKLHVFRLPGIYGPGRSALDRVRAGSARRIVKPGHLTNRMHVEDIAATLTASIGRPRPGAVYALADDEPAPPQDVIAFAAALLGIDPPPEQPFATAGLSGMAAGFYAEAKRVRNARIKAELAVRLTYPTYREGLQALAARG
jgi:nucleoside-diphosphate-sugar epimerase